MVRRSLRPGLALILSCSVALAGLPHGLEARPLVPQTISLSEYESKAILVKNPMDLTALPLNKTFQVGDPHFLLQFFLDQHRIIGMVLKRDAHFPIRVRWCFFRSCEEHPFDYRVTIAEPDQPPHVNGFFEVKVPASLNYSFQGMHFTGEK